MYPVRRNQNVSLSKLSRAAGREREGGRYAVACAQDHGAQTHEFEGAAAEACGDHGDDEEETGRWWVVVAWCGVCGVSLLTRHRLEGEF